MSSHPSCESWQVAPQPEEEESCKICTFTSKWCTNPGEWSQTDFIDLDLIIQLSINHWLWLIIHHKIMCIISWLDSRFQAEEDIVLKSALTVWSDQHNWLSAAGGITTGSRQSGSGKSGTQSWNRSMTRYYLQNWNVFAQRLSLLLAQPFPSSFPSLLFPANSHKKYLADKEPCHSAFSAPAYKVSWLHGCLWLARKIRQNCSITVLKLLLNAIV